MDFYDGTKLLSLKDINNKKPGIYICTSNRSAGKTTYFNRLAFNRFIKSGKKFGLIYRYNYELDDISDKYFKDINQLFFPKYTMQSKRRANGIFHELFSAKIYGTDDEEIHWHSCGYGLTLNSADNLKKYSHLLSDIDLLIFDEFMSESNNYCANEVRKFLSLLATISRGKGQMHREVPVIMISNPVSLINPYYIALGISHRLNQNTKFLKGDGFVLEQGFNQKASDSLNQSAFLRAFKNDEYTAYASQGIYLNDNLAFIEKLEGNNKYLGTIRYDGVDYALRSYYDLGLVYVDYKIDKTYPIKIVVKAQDHDINYVMLNNHALFIAGLKKLFDKGCFRFKDLKCKEILINTIAY